VALVHAESGKNLETLSNFFPAGTSSSSSSSSSSKTRNASNRSNTTPPASAAAATGIGFGGKSRYLVVSDASGCSSVWDLKKTARVRTFRIPKPSSGSSSSSASSGAICTAARIDPTDTFVAAASGWDTDGALRLYRLREGNLAATLRDVRSDESTEWDGHGGISALEFSPLDKAMVSVGTKNGSILLWDVQAAAKVGVTGGGPSTSPSKSKALVPPTIRMSQRHGGEVTGIAFSPVNTVLLASSSADGSVGFHDTKMCRTIQSFRPPVNENVVSSSGNSNSAVMSVSFASDGVTCAAGTADGRALIYDLRNVRAGPLSILEFVPNRSGGGSLPVPPVLNVRFTSLGATSSPVVSAPVMTAERNEAAMTASTDPPKIAQPEKQVDEAALSDDQTRHQENRALPSTTTVSEARKAAPLPEPASQEPRSADSTPSENASAVSNSSGGVSFAPEEPSNDSVRNDDEEEKESSTGDTSATKNFADSLKQTNDVGAMAEKSLESLLSKLSASSTNDLPSVPTTDDDTAAQVSDSPDLTVNKLVLRRMIQDEIDDLREEMASSISNVHIDMLRQFQRQATEMQAMFQRQAQAIEELMEQNRLLREENERLKLPVYEW